MKDAAKDPGASRREFLRKVLRAGAYAAPLVVCMSMRNLAAAQATKPHGHMGKG